MDGDDTLQILSNLPERLEDFDGLFTGQPIWHERLQGVGVINSEECLALGVTESPVQQDMRGI